MNPMFHALETPSVPQPTPQNSQNTGFLQIHVVSIQNHFLIRNATLRISPAKENTEVLEELKTNTSGQTPEIALPAPPESISLDASAAINGPMPNMTFVLKRRDFSRWISPEQK